MSQTAVQYLSSRRVAEATGYSESAIKTWARQGRLPAQQDDHGHWFVQHPFPPDFRPGSRPYRRLQQDSLLVVGAAPEPEQAPLPEAAAPVARACPTLEHLSVVGLAHCAEATVHRLDALVAEAKQQTWLLEELVALWKPTA